MASIGIPNNLIPNEPQLKDLLDLFKKDILLGLNCHHIGTINVFNPLNQTATATVNYPKTYFEPDPITGTLLPTLKTYPILVDCPVIVLGGGLGSLTFPIAPGDECLILFNDRDMDNWFAGGTGSPVNTPRLHSFADGVILVGIRSLPNVLSSYDPLNVVLQNGTAYVQITPLLIKIANNTNSLGSLLQSLLTQLTLLTTQLSALTVTGVTPGGGVSGVPSNAAAITAIGTQITTIATEMALLLE